MTSTAKTLPTFYYEEKNILQNLRSALAACNNLTNAQLLELPGILMQQEETSTRNELLAAIEYLACKKGLLH